MTVTSLELSAATRRLLLRRGLRLEYATIAWNVVGSVLVLAAAVTARSVALAGFGLDSLIEIVASAVVVWQLKDTDRARERKALRLIGYAFVLLALYIGAQSLVVLAAGFRPHHSLLGISWLALTALAMFALAYGKSSTGCCARQSRARNRGASDDHRRSARGRGAGRARPERRARVVVGRPARRACHRLLRPA